MCLSTFRHALVAALTAFLLSISNATPAEAVRCGGKDQAACSFSAAKRLSKGLCAKGGFLDVGRGECWSCPRGYDRTARAVTSAKACKKAGWREPARATKRGKPTCGNDILDIGRGECWRCPKGYRRSLAAVTSAKACLRPGRDVPAKATFHKRVGCFGRGVFYDARRGGECWRCPRGYGRSAAPVTATNACAKGILGETKRASYVSKHGCSGRGVFLDLRKGGQCWSCPKGYRRSTAAVTAENACLRAVTADHEKATYLRKAGCGRGFLDIGRGECWSCPSGYDRSTTAVTAKNACLRSIPAQFNKASFRSRAGCPKGSVYDIGRGECWSCPKGYRRSVLPVTGAKACTAARPCAKGLVNISGVCRQHGRCGGRNQRPCLIAERVPSCNNGLREDFRNNRCVSLKRGETPFTAGLASLAGEVSRTSDICQSVLSAMPALKSSIPAVDAGAACVRNMHIGFVCALPKAADKVKDTAELFQRVNREYQTSPCKDRLRWYHARAKKRGKAKGLNCPGRQFFDLKDGGSCWSCPGGHVRSEEPVTSKAACVRATGTPAMFRAACAGTMAMVRDAGDQLRCLAAMVKTGVLAKAFRGKQRDMCIFAGEEAYFTALDVLTGTTNPKTRLERLVKKLRQLNKALNKASSANSFMKKVDGLRACDGVFDRSAKSGTLFNITVGGSSKKK